MAADKFCRVEGDVHVPHDYGNVWFEQASGSHRRLVIGPSAEHVDLLTELSVELTGEPWFLLYVLLVPRTNRREAGRYQSPPFATHAALSAFLAAFRVFFETDGRHHVWVGSGSNDGVLVYDQHDVIFAYGPLERFRSILAARGFREKEFWFPAPHAHAYLPENDTEEERLMAELEWRHFPLQPGDDDA